MKERQANKKRFVGPNRHTDDSYKVKNTDENNQLATQGFLFCSRYACPAIIFRMISSSGVYRKDNSFSILLRS